MKCQRLIIHNVCISFPDVFNSFAEPSPATSTKIEHFPEADMFDAGI